MALLEKFGAEQGGQHPGPLTWPGSDLGLPILGRVAPNLRQEEFENIDHKCVYDAAEFRSWVPEDMTRYKYIQERANNVGDGGVTWFAVRQYERYRDPQQRGWLIWLEWIQVYGILPKDRDGRDAIRELVRKDQDIAVIGPAGDSSAGLAGTRGYFDPFVPRRHDRG